MALALISDIARSAMANVDRPVLKASSQVEVKLASRVARPVPLPDSNQISAEAFVARAARLSPSSVIPFDIGATEATHPGAARLEAKLNGLGWGHDATQVGLDTHGTFLHYAVAGSENGPEAWHDVPLQYLHDGTKGFLLRDVAPGTPIEAAPHVIVDHSADHWYSINGKTPDDASAWLTAPGESLAWTTEAAK